MTLLIFCAKNGCKAQEYGGVQSDANSSLKCIYAFLQNARRQLEVQREIATPHCGLAAPMKHVHINYVVYSAT